MTITRTLQTKSSQKYLNKRTVCIPLEFYNTIGYNDTVVIIIDSGYNQDITITTNLAQMETSGLTLKKAYGDEFYTLPY